MLCSVFGLLMVMAGAADAASFTRTSAATSSWAAPATWTYTGADDDGIPDADDDVAFPNGATTTTTTLDGNQAAQSLVFSGTATQIIDPGSASTSNLTVGNGGILKSGSASVNIKAPLVLGSDQAFTSSAANPLNISGGVTGAAHLTARANSTGNILFSTAPVNNAGTFTNAGAGSGTTTISAVLGSSVTSITQSSGSSTLILSGANTSAGGFGSTGATGTVTVTAGTLKLAGSGSALGAANALTVNGGTFDLGGVINSVNIASLSDGGVTAGIVTNSGGTLRQLVLNGSSTTTFGGLVTGSVGITASGATNLTLTNANTHLGGVTVNTGATLKGTNVQSFGLGTGTNTLNVAGGTLILVSDGTGSGQSITYGGTANLNGYNLTSSGGTIVLGSGGTSTGNTVQLGTLTFTTGTLNFTGTQGYAANFSGALTQGTGTGAPILNTNATPVTVAGVALTSGKSLTVLGTGAFTSNGALTISSGTGTNVALNVGTSSSGGTAGNVVLKGSGSTITGGSTIAGGSLTLFNEDSLGSANTIALSPANGTNGTTGTAILNLRNDADTNYGNPILVLAGTGASIVNADQATSGNSGHTLALGTLSSNRTLILTNGNSYNLGFGAASSPSSATLTNNTVNGMTTLASFTDSASNSQSLTINGTGATTSIGPIAQNGGAALAVKQNGSGTLVLSGANTYTGATTIGAGSLVVTGSLSPASAVSVNGGLLGGSGTVGPVNVAATAGSTLDPGTPRSGQTLTTGNVTMSSGGRLNVDLLATSTYDSLAASGTVALGNSTLTLTLGFAPTAGQTFTIVSSGGARNGSFANGNLVSAMYGGQTYTFAVSYNANSVTLTAAGPSASSGAIISEFRTRGSKGTSDEYVELLNTTDEALNISGWTLSYTGSGSAVSLSIPANSSLPSRGHFLLVNPGAGAGTGYSLTSNAVADASLTGDVDDGSALTLSNAAGVAQDTAGTGGAGTSPTSNGEFAFVRPPGAGAGSSFTLVSVDGTSFGSSLRAVLGAPGPQNIGSPVSRDDVISVALFDPASPNGPNRRPNRDRQTGATGANAAVGTILFRRTITNNSTRKITHLRFRLNTITTLNSPGYASGGAQADLRFLSSGQQNVARLSDGVTVPVFGTSLEVPPAQPNGGGQNSSLTENTTSTTETVGTPSAGAGTVGTVMLGMALGPGESRSYNFLFGVAQDGSFSVVFNLEAVLTP